MSSPGPALKGSMRGGVALATGVAVLAAMPATAQSAAPVTAVQVDPIFATFNSDTAPGCAVAVDRAGQRVLTRAYGMADLEHGIRNSADTVFEAGSVSKQFTAAAVALLAGPAALIDGLYIRHSLRSAPLGLASAPALVEDYFDTQLKSFPDGQRAKPSVRIL